MKVNQLVLNLASSLSRVIPYSFKKFIYQNEPLSNIIRKSLNKFAPEGYQKVTIGAGMNTGLAMVLDLQSEKDYWLGTYEPELQQAIEKLVEPNQVIFDIGANIGYVTLMFANNVGSGGRVYAFEALPQNVSRLNQNITINDFQSRVTIIQAAVQIQSGETEFLIGPSDAMGKASGSAGRENLEYQEKIVVKGISIDESIKDSGTPMPDIVKIDVEGGEVLVLPGMRELLKQRRPIIFLELHGSDSAQISWYELTKSGYKICLMEAGFPRVKHFEDLDWKSYVVAFPEDE